MGGLLELTPVDMRLGTPWVREMKSPCPPTLKDTAIFQVMLASPVSRAGRRRVTPDAPQEEGHPVALLLYQVSDEAVSFLLRLLRQIYFQITILDIMTVFGCKGRRGR